ncbi:MAG: DctP family TRAP transporter solute-binding subunit [Clostridia bacterium]|nr:DctP family TRAP transporter solute-binding subunit [Clostridia bacterium]
MKTMNRMIAVILSLVLILTMMTACGGNNTDAVEEDANVDEKILIKVGHGNPESNAIHEGWLKFQELVEAKSNGNIEVEIYPNGQLGGDRELIEALQMGNVTMSSPSSAPLASFNKNFFVLDIPFLFKDRQQVYSVLDGNAGQELLKTFEEYNIKGLAFMENGFRNLTNSKAPVKTPEDLNGLKIRTMENELHLAAWTLLGANPTPMAFGELFTALQQKTVDGQENPFELIYSVKFYEVQDYISKTQHIYTPYVIIMNNEFYVNLSDENKEIIDASIKEATDYQRGLAKQKDVESEKAIKEAGVEVIELTDEEKAAFKNKLTPLFDQVKEKAGSEMVDLFVNATK